MDITENQREIMKIFSALLKGMKLKAPKGEKTRPTAAMIRQAVIHKLSDKLQGALFLDLFAGTGAMGLEAMAQGALEVYFVESDKNAICVLEENIKEANRRFLAQDLEKPIFELIKKSVDVWLKNQIAKKFDIIWADPPYGLKLFHEEWFLKRLAEISSESVSVVFEMGTTSLKEFEEHLSCFQIIQIKSYSDTSVVYLTKKN